MKLYLIHPNREQTSIFADINYRKFRFRTSTNIIIKSAHWDGVKEKVTSANPNYAVINARLKIISSNIDSYIANLRINKQNISFDDFKFHINNFISPDNKISYTNTDSPNLIQHLELFISKMEYLKAFQPKTISHYEHLKKILIDYSKYSFRTYYPEDMSNGFYEDFTRYMRVQRDFVDTTTGTVIKVLKSFLNKIVKEGINVNPDYRDFKVIRVTIPQTIALTEEEIEEIDKLELNDKKMEFGRDLMFVQLHTAQRRSDLFQIRKEHIDLNQKKIKLTQIKTGNQVVLPLTDKMLEMLEKYSYQLPQMSKSDYNIALKKLCKAAGLMELTEIIRMQGNVRKAIVKPRYAFVSSHTIRRTAITILLRRGVMPEYVRKVAGIKSYEVFQKYIKLSQDEAVDSVRDFWNK